MALIVSTGFAAGEVLRIHDARCSSSIPQIRHGANSGIQYSDTDSRTVVGKLAAIAGEAFGHHPAVIRTTVIFGALNLPVGDDLLDVGALGHLLEIAGANVHNMRIDQIE